MYKNFIVQSLFIYIYIVDINRLQLLIDIEFYKIFSILGPVNPDSPTILNGNSCVKELVNRVRVDLREEIKVHLHY